MEFWKERKEHIIDRLMTWKMYEYVIGIVTTIYLISDKHYFIATLSGTITTINIILSIGFNRIRGRFENGKVKSKENKNTN